MAIGNGVGIQPQPPPTPPRLALLPKEFALPRANPPHPPYQQPPPTQPASISFTHCPFLVLAILFTSEFVLRVLLRFFLDIRGFIPIAIRILLGMATATYFSSFLRHPGIKLHCTSDIILHLLASFLPAFPDNPLPMFYISQSFLRLAA